MLLSSAELQKESVRLCSTNIVREFLTPFVKNTHIKQLLFSLIDALSLVGHEESLAGGGGAAERGTLLLPIHTNERKLQTCF